MAIDVRCQACGKQYRLNDELAGKKFKCKQCEAIVLATPSSGTNGKAAPQTEKRPRSEPPAGQSPRPRPAAQQTTSQPPKKKPVGAGSSGAGQPVKKKKRPAPAADPYANDAFGALDEFGGDYGDAWNDDAADPYGSPPPRRKKSTAKSFSKSKSKTQSKAKSGAGGFGLPAMTFNFNRLNAALVVIGGMLIFFGFQEIRLRSRSGTAPLEITLSELLKNGPGSGVYLTVTGKLPTDDGFVYSERGGRYTEVWVPCVPIEGTGNANFLLYSKKTPTESDVAGMAMNASHTGMIINDITGLDAETKKLLGTIPGVNPDTALVFEVDRTPASVAKIGAMILGGLLLMLGGLFWIFFVHS
ncbi:MAG: hypothetical protein R3C49_20675 [Planctomycetaceae bacterium]